MLPSKTFQELEYVQRKQKLMILTQRLHGNIHLQIQLSTDKCKKKTLSIANHKLTKR